MRLVTVNGAQATLWLVPGATRPVEQARLLTQDGETRVLTIAYAGGPIRPGGPDSNPLVDEETFLSVMQNLRPYPE
jgi:hypothetical protein